MVQKLLCFFATVAVIFFVTGCVSVMQTSAKVLEDGEYFYFPSVYDAVEARFSEPDTLYLKCPLSVYKREYTWVKMALIPSYFGGYNYNFFACKKDDCVWIKVLHCSPDTMPGFYSKFMYEPKSVIIENELPHAKKIEIPTYDNSDVFDSIHFYGVDAEPSRMNTPLPLVRTRSGNGFWRTTAAISCGIFIDFPASVFMTLTGSFWYIPLTRE